MMGQRVDFNMNRVQYFTKFPIRPYVHLLPRPLCFSMHILFILSRYVANNVHFQVMDQVMDSASGVNRVKMLRQISKCVDRKWVVRKWDEDAHNARGGNNLLIVFRISKILCRVAASAMFARFCCPRLKILMSCRRLDHFRKNVLFYHLIEVCLCVGL